MARRSASPRTLRSSASGYLQTAKRSKGIKAFSPAAILRQRRLLTGCGSFAARRGRRSFWCCTRFPCLLTAISLRGRSELSNELFQRLGRFLALLDVSAGLFAENQAEQCFKNTSSRLTFSRLATSAANEQPVWHQRLNALGKLVGEHIQCVEARISISANFLQVNRRFSQTNLRNAGRFAPSDQFLRSRFALSVPFAVALWPELDSASPAVAPLPPA